VDLHVLDLELATDSARIDGITFHKGMPVPRSDDRQCL
jgi:hypothetical protein